MAEENPEEEKARKAAEEKQREFIREVIREVVSADMGRSEGRRLARRVERQERSAARAEAREQQKGVKEKLGAEEKPMLKVDMTPIQQQAKKDREAQNQNLAQNKADPPPARDSNEQERKNNWMNFLAPRQAENPLPSFNIKETLYGAGLMTTARIDHMWKVSKGTEVNTEDPDYEEGLEMPWSVRGGVVTVQGETVEVADRPNLPGSGDGFVVLKVERDPDSRAYVAASAEIQWSATEPVNHPSPSESEEFYILAQIISGEIRQHRFEEIISYELMVVVNGELKLGPFSMLTRNVYDLPEPEPEP
jgi:hypothetical protein